jgi:hypothetical protein
MSDASLLMLSLGPVAIHVKVDRESKGISDAQLKRKWAIDRTALDAAPNARRSRIGIAVECAPTVRVECE